MENNSQLMEVKQSQSLREIMQLGKVFAESGLFGDTKAVGQAIVKIQANQEIRIPPFQAMTGIHIIQGKPIVGAGLIASRVKGSNKYDYKVIEHTDKICSIDFYQGKDWIGNSSFSVEDAKKAGTKNLDKFPKNMLFARAISNGAKFYCPDVFSGSVYVPGEIEEEDDNTGDDNKNVLPEKARDYVESVFSKCENYNSLVEAKEHLLKYKPAFGKYSDFEMIYLTHVDRVPKTASIVEELPENAKVIENIVSDTGNASPEYIDEALAGVGNG